jgi:hypothetical protein
VLKHELADIAAVEADYIAEVLKGCPEAFGQEAKNLDDLWPTSGCLASALAYVS